MLKIVLTTFITNSLSSLRAIHSNVPKYINFTPVLLAEPLKKKKKMDPAVIKQREERRKKKIEKQIRRLEKNAKQLKPIDECEVPMEILNDKNRARSIKVSQDELNKRLSLMKSWAQYKYKQHLADSQMIDRILYSQQLALDQLRQESEELYQAAVQIDPQLIPFIAKGPVETPPIKDFDSPDGEYIDISKKWEH